MMRDGQTSLIVVVVVVVVHRLVMQEALLRCTFDPGQNE
jgi:hypothetical protein